MKAETRRAYKAPGLLVAGAMTVVTFALGAAEMLTPAGAEQAVREDMKATIRPGDPAKGVPFWNGYSVFFMYAPSFQFKEVKGAAEYRYLVFDENHTRHDFTAKTPYASLSGVWPQIPVGVVTVICDGIAADGSPLATAGERTFVKTAPFTGLYPKAKRTYAEAARKTFDYLASSPCVAYLAEHGEPDPNYCLNTYPSKMHGANLAAMLEYARLCPEKRELAMKVARAEAEYLLSIMQPADAALPYFPPTYDKSRVIPGFDGGSALKYDGMSMNIYPAHVGAEFLDYYEETKDARFLEAAKKIAGTFIREQLPSGTWYIKQYLKDAKPVKENLLVPGDIMSLFLGLHRLTGEKRYLEVADKALKWIDENPLKTWNWEGQFEDVEPKPPYEDLTHHSCCNVALFLLQRFPKDARRLAEAREILRFCEDQFVFWQQPGRPGVMEKTKAKFFDYFIQYPSAYEQYDCYCPIDASAAKMIRLYLALYESEGKALDLLKAKALADSMVNIQDDDGRIPTFWFKDFQRTGDWMNCMSASAEALMAMAKYQAVCDAYDAEAESAVIRPDFKIVVGGKEVKPIWKGDRIDFAAMIPDGRSRLCKQEPYEATGVATVEVAEDGEYSLDLDADWQVWVKVNGKEVYALTGGWLAPNPKRAYFKLHRGKNEIAFRFSSGSEGSWLKFRLSPLKYEVKAKIDESAVSPRATTF